MPGNVSAIAVAEIMRTKSVAEGTSGGDNKTTGKRVKGTKQTSLWRALPCLLDHLMFGLEQSV